MGVRKAHNGLSGMADGELRMTEDDPCVRRVAFGVGLFLVLLVGLVWSSDDAAFRCFTVGGCMMSKSMGAQGRLRVADFMSPGVPEDEFQPMEEDESESSTPTRPDSSVDDYYGGGGGDGNTPESGASSIPSSIPELGDLSELDADYTPLLPKKTFWERSRVLFIAGLQGTGHHVWRKALADSCGGPDVTCVPLCKSSSTQWFSWMNYKQYEDIIAEVEKEMEAMRVRVEKEGESTNFVFLVNLFSDHCKGGTTQLEFPLSERDLDAALFPDLRAHARLAEEKKLDLRFVFLLERDMKKTADTWLTTYSGSPFARTNFHILRTLQLGFEAMYGHMRLLDNRFYAGVDMESMALLQKDTTLEEWTGLPGITDALKQAAHLKYHPKRSTRKLNQYDEKYLPRVQIAHDMFSQHLATRVSRPFVIKRVTRTPETPRPRILFFAGMEGTGHHLFSSIFVELYKQHPNFEAGCSIQRILYHQNSKASMWEATDTVRYLQAESALRSELKKLANDPTKQNSTVLVNLMDRGDSGCVEIVGEMSYPNFGGAFKTFQHPDLITLASIAEEAGVELQVVLLERNAEKIIISTTVHRHFGKKRELNVLEPVAFALYAQLQAVSPEYLIACVNFGDRSLSYVPRLAAGMGVPDLLPLVESVMEPSTTHYKDDEMNLRKRRITTFNATTNAFLEFCPA